MSGSERRRPWRVAQHSAPRAPTPAPIPDQPRGMRISDYALGRSAAKPTGLNPFALPIYPPGVVPSGASMAMDDALSSPMAWAGGSIDWALHEGQAFLGYPILAELAQRPEYRRIAETVARHMTSKWIKITVAGDEDKSDKVHRVETVMRRLRVQDTFREAAEHEGLFGRGHIYIDLGTTDDRDELRLPIGDGRDRVSKAKVGKGSLKAFRSVEPVWCYPSGYNSTDPLAPGWYRPETWFVMGKQVHASRLMTFIGREVPDLLKPAYAFGGLPMSQMAKPYVDNWLRTRQSVADIVNAFSVFVLKTNMTETLMAAGEQLFNRAELFNNLRDNRGLMMLDKEMEDFANVAAPLGGLDALQAQSQEHMAAVSGIPLVELLGIQPTGLNASSEGEMKTFDDVIHNAQETLFRPHLTTILGLIQLSEFGEVDPDIDFAFERLWSLSDKEVAEKQLTEAQIDQIYVDAGILSIPEVRTRIAGDAEMPYAGLDIDDVPIPTASEALGEGGEEGEEGPSPPKPTAKGI